MNSACRPTRLSRAWIGSVAQKVIGLAEEPVLVAVTSLSLPPPTAHSCARARTAFP
mgnify:CR=1 FL=1